MTQSPYARVGPGLVQLGYSAIPIAPGNKAPGEWYSNYRWRRLEGWSGYCFRLPDVETVSRWATWPDAGVGICLGPASGIVAVDFDTHADLWPRLEAAIPTSPVRKRGKNGYTAFYRYGGEQLRRFSVPGDDKPTIEILSTGGQTVIPPSEHPDTKRPYEWDGPGLLEVPRDELPCLPGDVAERFAEIIGIKRFPTPAPGVEHGDFGQPSREWVADMLAVIPPEVDAPTWLRVASSIKSIFPNGTGFELWNTWSARDKREVKPGVPQYQPRRMARDWEKLDPGANGVTPRTIFGLARDAGYTNWHFDQNRYLEGIPLELKPRVRSPFTEAAPARPRFTLDDELVIGAAGLVGDLTRWIVETAMQPQPVLALGAALSAVGALKGHRVRSETDLRTNIYVLGLAESGSGKRHPIDAVRTLFREAGCDHLLGKEPGSQPGLCQTLRDGHGVSLLMWDEIGHAISAMCDRNNGSHYTSIMATITNLFTEASSFHEGKALAQGSRESIEQPCLCICGMTVEERLFESLTKENASDGFLPRWMIFEVETNNPKLCRTKGLRKVPKGLIDQVVEIVGAGGKGGWPLHAPENAAERLAGGRRPLDHSIYDPRWVPYTDDAREAYWSCREEFSARAELEAGQGRGARAIWNRAAEHIARVALIVSGYRETGMREFEWARRLVVSRCEALCDSVARRIGQNEKERSTKKVYELIRECDNGIPKNVLTRKTQWLTSQERNGIISTLIDSEQIRIVRSETSSPGRPSMVYAALE